MKRLYVLEKGLVKLGNDDFLLQPGLLLAEPQLPLLHPSILS